MSTAGFHITEDCAEVYLQNESGTEFLQLARRLHDYLQQGQHLPVRSLFEATDGCKEISREAFDTLAKRRMENTGEVSGVFELDFDARTLSALNIMDGWKVYAMQDVADAAVQAYQEAEISEDDRWRIFLDWLEGQELTTPSKLTARNFYFEDTDASANPTLADENTSSTASHHARLPTEYLLNSTIRLFHQIGQIFRENAAPPSNPMGIRIDSKRRKKLMQKRLAMGHKQDDHEQNYGQTLQ